jgi:NADH-quinone oxidoreductase subunit A
MSFDLSVVLGLLLMSAALLWLLLVVGKAVRMRKPGADKLSTYECGERPFGPAWFNFNNRFYVIGLAFVAFDVQVALAVPVIVAFRKLLGVESGAALFATLFVYLGLMMLALAYVWRHGDLSWVKELSQNRNVTTLPYATTRAIAEAAAREPAAGHAEGSA